MQIPSEYLKETSYEGTRLIEINDETVAALQAELDALQKEANPFLKEMEAFTPEMDAIYGEIQEMKNRETELKKQIAPTRAKYDALQEELMKIDARAVPIKDKMTVIINELISKDLAEFETPVHTIVKEGKLFVEVRDEIEEKVKQVRELKVKNATSK